MIVEVNGENIERLYIEFMGEKKYCNKVAFFEKYFGLVSYDLPFLDPELSWFRYGRKTMDIIDIFEKESNRSTNLYERVFFLNDHVISFSIKPVSRVQRLLLNKNIIRYFVKDKEVLRKLVEKELEGVSDQASYITERLSELNQTVAWMTKKLEEPVCTSVKIKFLAIFHKGYSSFYEDEKKILTRRRIVELYLYCQGLLFSNYQHVLREKLVESRSNQQDNMRPLFTRLALLDKLGVIKYLKQACVLKEEKMTEEKIAKLLCFIMNVNPALYCSVLACIRSGSLSDLHLVLSDQELQLICKSSKEGDINHNIIL